MESLRHLAENKRATLSRTRRSKATSFPKGVGYNIPVPRDLLASEAWLAMSPQCRKLIDAIMMEWADHGGEQNGSLKVPYDMLEARGMRRQTIPDAIAEGEALGIIDAARGQRSYGSRRSPSQYRLTWLGTPNGLAATHDWRAIKTKDEAGARVRNALELLGRERSAKRALRVKRAAERTVSVATKAKTSGTTEAA